MWATYKKKDSIVTGEQSEKTNMNADLRHQTVFAIRRTQSLVCVVVPSFVCNDYINVVWSNMWLNWRHRRVTAWSPTNAKLSTANLNFHPHLGGIWWPSVINASI